MPSLEAVARRDAVHEEVHAVGIRLVQQVPDLRDHCIYIHMYAVCTRFVTGGRGGYINKHREARPAVAPARETSDLAKTTKTKTPTTTAAVAWNDDFHRVDVQYTAGSL